MAKRLLNALKYQEMADEKERTESERARTTTTATTTTKGKKEPNQRSGSTTRVVVETAPLQKFYAKNKVARPSSAPPARRNISFTKKEPTGERPTSATVNRIGRRKSKVQPPEVFLSKLASGLFSERTQGDEYRDIHGEECSPAKIAGGERVRGAKHVERIDDAADSTAISYSSLHSTLPQPSREPSTKAMLGT